MRSKQRLKVALVNPPITGHKLRGTGIYTANLYQALKENAEVAVELINYEDNQHFFDIIHYPYFDPFFITLPVLKRKPTIVTIHDLIPIKYPQFLQRGVKGEIKWQIQKYSLKRSSAVITDSISSKQDICHFTGFDERKIHVIYLGVNAVFKPIKSTNYLNTIRKEIKLPEEFILHVGDVNYNKNIPGLLRAFAIVAEKISSLHLVLIGNGFIMPSKQLIEIQKMIKTLNLEDKVHLLGHVKTKDLVGIYNLASIYLQASFAEGFGLPILEAMACGCPVIASNISSLPELVDDAGILVDPLNHKEIAHKIIILFHDKKKGKELSRKGLVRSRLFTWKECADRTIDVYKKISA